MKNIVIVSLILVFTSCNEREKIVPVKPFIVIDMEPYTYATVETGMRYKTIDNNGYVFYFSEHLIWREHPRYSLGDTIK